MKRWFQTWNRPEYKEWATKISEGYLPRTQNALTVRSGMNGLFPRSEPLMPRA